jgi:sodium ion-translocating decarboxylase beta subunit
MENLLGLWFESGIYQMTYGQAGMMLICSGLLFLAIKKGFEPLLLVPIGFGGLLANIPGAGLAFSAAENAILAGDTSLLADMARLLGADISSTAQELMKLYGASDYETHHAATQLASAADFHDGMLYSFYKVAIASGVAPLLIFMGVGAMTDFGPLLANPKTLFLGAAAQFGIFATVIGAVSLSALGLMDFSIADAAAIGIIGGADGPTAIYVASKLAPDLLGAIAVAAYSYMALVPLIQPH